MNHRFLPLYAAVLVPRNASGEVDQRAFREILEFLLARNISGIVLNGATGEYCVTTPLEVAALLASCRETLRGRAEFLCSIGAAGVAGSLALAKLAIESGGSGLLLPMPHFFPYSQDDLHCYCEAVADSAGSPLLLYNLPQFTTPLEPATVLDLVKTVPNVVGIKDSSGRFEIFRALEGTGALRFVGDDSVLVQALDDALCEGAVSGVAGVLPELVRFLYFSRSSAGYTDAVRAMAELIKQLSVFPTPWGLKLIAECRGLAPAHFLQPVSKQRQRQIADFRQWFAAWWQNAAALVKAN